MSSVSTKTGTVNNGSEDIDGRKKRSCSSEAVDPDADESGSKFDDAEEAKEEPLSEKQR